MGGIDRTDQRIGRLATAAKGIVTRSALLDLGVTDREIEGRVEKGALIRVHRGVYRVGHVAPSIEATYLAAVKACGIGAVLFDSAAGYHQAILRTPTPPAPEVLCPTQRSVPGVKTRRCRHIDPVEIATYRGIPITTVPRTLLDLAAHLTEGELARAAHEAWVRHRTRASYVLAVLQRHPRAKGARKLRAVMCGDVNVTLSRLEAMFLRAMSDAEIELPETNQHVDGKYVDCRWRGRLTVELDSYAFHNSHHAWEQHHQRRRAARARGEEFRTFTWWDVTEGREAMVDDVRGLLRG